MDIDMKARRTIRDRARTGGAFVGTPSGRSGRRGEFSGLVFNRRGRTRFRPSLTEMSVSEDSASDCGPAHMARHRRRLARKVPCLCGTVPPNVDLCSGGRGAREREGIMLRASARRAVLAGVLAAVAIAPATAAAAVDPLTLVSGPSPFAAGCEGAPQTGTVFRNAEVEPWVDVNLADANNLVARYRAGEVQPLHGRQRRQRRRLRARDRSVGVVLAERRGAPGRSVDQRLELRQRRADV